MKKMTVLSLVAFLASSAAHAEKLVCTDPSGSEARIYVNTDPVDPENAAGTIYDAGRKGDLYLTDGGSEAATVSTYQISGSGWGDGDTDFFYIALPNVILQGKAKIGNGKLIEKSDQHGKKATSLRCRAE